MTDERQLIFNESVIKQDITNSTRVERLVLTQSDEDYGSVLDAIRLSRNQQIPVLQLCMSWWESSMMNDLAPYPNRTEQVTCWANNRYEDVVEKTQIDRSELTSSTPGFSPHVPTWTFRSSVRAQSPLSNFCRESNFGSISSYAGRQGGRSLAYHNSKTMEAASKLRKVRWAGNVMSINYPISRFFFKVYEWKTQRSLCESIKQISLKWIRSITVVSTVFIGVTNT